MAFPNNITNLIYADKNKFLDSQTDIDINGFFPKSKYISVKSGKDWFRLDAGNNSANLDLVYDDSLSNFGNNFTVTQTNLKIHYFGRDTLAFNSEGEFPILKYYVPVPCDNTVKIAFNEDDVLTEGSVLLAEVFFTDNASDIDLIDRSMCFENSFVVTFSDGVAVEVDKLTISLNLENIVFKFEKYNAEMGASYTFVRAVGFSRSTQNLTHNSNITSYLFKKGVLNQFTGNVSLDGDIGISTITHNGNLITVTFISNVSGYSIISGNNNYVNKRTFAAL